VTDPSDADVWRVKLRAELKTAMKARDTVATSALRSLLSAIDNAEAPDVSTAPHAEHGVIAGGVAGLGAGEVDRLQLSSADIALIVRREVASRSEAAEQYECLGQHDQAEIVRSEVAALERFLPFA
jgi:uncharacterized protein